MLNPNTPSINKMVTLAYIKDVLAYPLNVTIDITNVLWLSFLPVGYCSSGNIVSIQTRQFKRHPSYLEARRHWLWVSLIDSWLLKIFWMALTVHGIFLMGKGDVKTVRKKNRFNGLNIVMKFYENPSNGIRVIEWTRQLRLILLTLKYKLDLIQRNWIMPSAQRLNYLNSLARFNETLSMWDMERTRK